MSGGNDLMHWQAKLGAATLTALMTLWGCAEGKTDFGSGGSGSGAGTSTGGAATGGGDIGGGGVGGQGGSGGSECAMADECGGVDLACSWRVCDAGQCGFTLAAAGAPCAYDGGKVCDGQGSCVECTLASQCAGGVCQNNICAEPGCVDGVKNGDETDVDCGGSCAPCVNGKICSVADDCVSGICNGTCQPCASDAACPQDHYCDGTGTCKPTKVNGDVCTASAQCQSGHCPAQDGVCCGTACSGSCEACMLAKTGDVNGSCAAVNANTDPDQECSDQGAQTCGSNDSGCNGNDGAPACNLYPSGTQCAPSSCSAGQESEASHCDGLGTCTAGGIALCAPYVCDGNGAACLSSCSQNSHCASGFECEAPDCTPVCPPATVKCNGTCIDPLSDETYCGADNSCQGYTTCGGGDQCESGICTTPTCQAEQITVDIPFTQTAGWLASGCCNEANYRHADTSTLTASFADPLQQGGTVSSVQVIFGVRHACNSQSNAMEFQLNGTTFGTWGSANGPHCNCSNATIALSQNNAAPASYVRGGSNTVSILHNASGTCMEAIATHSSLPPGTAFRVIIDKTCP